MERKKAYWLMKSEPETYGIDHLKKDGKTPWSGVRNYQARNYMRSMEVGDTVLFYHSSCAVPGIYGIGRVASPAHPDPTQFDHSSDYYDPKASREKPIWYLVDVAFVKKLRNPVTLSDMRADASLHTMITLQPGSRLSITPVTEKEFIEIKQLIDA